MKTIHENWNALLDDCLQIALICGTIGISLKFITFFDKWVFFPSFPNILDSTFLILSVLYLTWKIRKNSRKMKAKNYSQSKNSSNPR